ncbi:hypothetical protein BRC64_03430 [Halobacteriales archaeon QH_10_67_22]|nr:MAG: hypothetical protein BRC64_03430 [Halobacteriales archaeon QH_10_67_22]
MHGRGTVGTRVHRASRHYSTKSARRWFPQTLQEKGLIERTGERERPGPPLERGDYGTTALWEPTVEGRAEARAIREAYAAGVEVRTRLSLARRETQADSSTRLAVRRYRDPTCLERSGIAVRGPGRLPTPERGMRGGRPVRHLRVSP